MFSVSLADSSFSESFTLSLGSTVTSLLSLDDTTGLVIETSGEPVFESAEDEGSPTPPDLVERNETKLLGSWGAVSLGSFGLSEEGGGGGGCATASAA